MIAQRIAQLAVRIDTLALRERLLLLSVVIAVPLMLADVLLFSGVVKATQQAKQRQEQVKTEIAGLDTQISELKERLKQNPNAETQARIDTLRAALVRVEAQLNNETLELVSPSQMISVLEALIQNRRSLSLIEVQSEAPEPLKGILPTTPSKDATRAAGLYRHGVTIVLRGEYQDLLDYLQAAERLGWRLFWDGLHIEVERYPMARIRLRVHALSLHKEWIGV